MSSFTLKTDDLINGIDKEVKNLKVAYKETPKPDLDNWKEVAKQCKFSLTATYSEPPIIIEIIDGAENCVFATLGNFSAIIEKAKSRKTFLVCLILAFCLKKSKTNKIQVYLSRYSNRILLFDTEQSNYHISRVVKRILSVSGTTSPENFDVFGLRAFPPAERLFLIEQIIYSLDDLAIVVIDGIRDLISDINNPDEATMITSKLLKWTEERNIHIITVLHQNKGDNNARGHLGSEIVNKAESVISIEKDNEISTIQSEYVRGKDFSPFAFSVNETGLPYIIEEYTTPGKIEKRKTGPFDYSMEAHLSMLKTVFNGDKKLLYKNLLTEISLVLQQNSINLGRNKIIEFQKFYHNKGWIDNVKEDKSQYPLWFLNPPV